MRREPPKTLPQCPKTRVAPQTHATRATSGDGDADGRCDADASKLVGMMPVATATAMGA